MKKKWFYVALLSTLILGLVGCGTKNSQKYETKKNETKTNNKLADKQVVSFAIPQEVASLDLSVGMDQSSLGLLNQVYEGFYRLDKKNNVIPAGAEELATISEDGLEYTLKLRKNAKWSNGDPVVADDYVYSWRRTVSPETASEYAYLFEPVKNAEAITAGEKKPEDLGIEAINDHEIKITLGVATPYFEYLLAFPTFFPLQQKTVEKYGKEFATNSDNAVYNGPFTLEEFDGVGSDIEWSYKKNKAYWDAKNVIITKINASVIKESSTSLNLFEAGQLDNVLLTGELAQQSQNNEAYTTDLDGAIDYIDFNKVSKTQHFDNVNLRKAIYHAIDSKSICEKVLGDGSIPATGFVPKNLASNPKTGKDYTEDSGIHKTFDVKKAKQFYKKAKKELDIETVSFNILTDDNDSMKKIAEFIQGSLKETLQIETTVTVVPKPIRLERTLEGDFDIVIAGWGADYNDPSSFLDLFVTGNSYNKGKYTNPRYDALIKEAATTNSTNPEIRWQNLLDAEKILLDDDAAIIPVYQMSEAALRNPKMKGYLSHTAGASYDYKYVYLEK